MEPLDAALEFIALCEREDSPPSQLESDLKKSIEALGFRYVALCAHVDPLDPPPRALMIHNYPEAWVQHFSKKRLYEIDPVLQRAECHPMPFFWDTVFHARSITAAQRKMLVDATDFGIARGFTVPIHMSWLRGALRTSCSVVPAAGAGNVKRLNYFMVGAMATAIYAALNDAHRPRLETAILLTRRERQCLILAAQGKDDWVIGQLLGLSHHTVHFYLKRLMHRLRVRKRIQAIEWARDTRQIPGGNVPSSREMPSSSR